MAIVPEDPETLLRREPAAAALTEIGFKTSAKTLATLATRGGGPRYRKFGRYPVYCWRDLVTWAQSRLGPVVTSTSQLDAARQHDRAQGGVTVDA